MTETWMPVVRYDGYEVSDIGNVRSVDREIELANRWGTTNIRRYKGRPINPHPNRYGRLQVHLGVEAREQVHRLVLEAFVGPCPEGMEALHWDDDPANNALGNLRWDTRSANLRDRVRNGRDPNAAKTHCDHGHPFDDANTYFNPARGGRQCRACVRQWQQNRRDRMKGAA